MLRDSRGNKSTTNYFSECTDCKHRSTTCHADCKSYKFAKFCQELAKARINIERKKFDKKTEDDINHNKRHHHIMEGQL